MSESDADKMSRVRLMASGSATWGLSRNDMAALKFVLVSLDAAESALAAVVRERDDLQRDVASQNAAFSAGYADGQRDMATRLTTAERDLAEARAYVKALLESQERLAAEVNASDTTRREWEVRAATSYADGRKAGLREAAEVCHAIKQENGDDPRVWLVDYMEECEQRILALAPPAAETEVDRG